MAEPGVATPPTGEKAKDFQSLAGSARRLLRLNLLVNDPEGVLPGYLNVDPLGQPGRDDIVLGAHHDLSHSVDANEAAEVRAIDVLHYASQAEVRPIVQHWSSRLAHGGRLVIGGVDLREVCDQAAQGMLPADLTGALLLGRQRAPWDCFHAWLALDLVHSLLKECGLEIERARYAQPSDFSKRELTAMEWTMSCRFLVVGRSP